VLLPEYAKVVSTAQKQRSNALFNAGLCFFDSPLNLEFPQRVAWASRFPTDGMSGIRSRLEVAFVGVACRRAGGFVLESKQGTASQWVCRCGLPEPSTGVGYRVAAARTRAIVATEGIRYSNLGKALGNGKQVSVLSLKTVMSHDASSAAVVS